jgi:pimeloyl-ACP methyl ester carboxylesterase
MGSSWKAWLDRLRPKAYGRKHSLVLLNGLAEQPESWYRNFRFWARYFDVHAPNVLAYSGTCLQRRIRDDEPISVDYLVERLHIYLDQFAQSPPYHMVSSSLGGKVAIEFAVRYPQLVSRLVLLCPSGMGDQERLPIMEGVRHSDYETLVRSVFYRPRVVDRDILRYYRHCFTNRRWKMGLLRTVRGTNDHIVRDKLRLVQQPTLFISGKEDRIVDPRVGAQAARDLANGHYLAIPHCGHAPQIEKAWLVNRLVVHFLTHPHPTSHPRLTQLFLHKPSRVTS